MTESPELRQGRAANKDNEASHQEGRNDKSEEEPVDQMFMPPKATNQYERDFDTMERSEYGRLQTVFQHKSEQKAFRPRKMMDNPCSYEEDIGSGLIGTGCDNNFANAKTPVKKPSNKNDHRGKSANQATYNGCIPSAELQAHMDKMRLRQQQSLSPFPAAYQRKSHMDSIQNMPYQQQLSPFYANPLLNSVHKSQNGLHMTPGTPQSLY